MVKKVLSSFVGCLLVLLLQTVYAQSASTQKQPELKLNHIALHVNNLSASADFYGKIMGLRKIQEPFNDGLHEWFSIGGVSQLHLIAGAPKNIFQDKKRHLCFSVASLDDFILHLNDNSIVYSDLGGKPNAVQHRADGIKQLYIQDPDGYWIEINNENLQ